MLIPNQSLVGEVSVVSVEPQVGDGISVQVRWSIQEHLSVVETVETQLFLAEIMISMYV